MNITSFRWPRCPILNTLPATLLRPRPKLRLYLCHALLTISELLICEGTITAVTVSLNHSSFWVQFFNPHASTASLHFKFLNFFNQKVYSFNRRAKRDIRIIKSFKTSIINFFRDGFTTDSNYQIRCCILAMFMHLVEDYETSNIKEK